MPIPSQNLTSIPEIVAFINTYIIPNGQKKITGDEDNVALNGLVNLATSAAPNYNGGLGAVISSTGGNVVFTSSVNIVSGVIPQTIAWNQDFWLNEYYIINTSASNLSLATGFSYYEITGEQKTVLTANTSIHIVKAINGVWINLYAPNTGGGSTPVTPITISSQPQGSSLNVGGSFTISVAATGGVSPLHYQLRKDGVNVTGQTTNTFTRTNAQTTDSGVYDYVITDAVGNILLSDPATISVSNVVLQKVYIGAKSTPGIPDAATILAGILSNQNAGGNVTADWTSFASSPQYLFWAIEASSVAAAKNYATDSSNPLNSGPMLSPTDTWDACVLVNVNGTNYYVSISTVATSVGGLIILSKT